MRIYLTSLLFSLFSFSALFGQTQQYAYSAVGKGVATPFLNDYQCLGINSSALGWTSGVEGKRFAMGSSEFGFGMYSDSLNANRLRNLSKIIRSQIGNGGNTSSIDYKQQLEAAAMYAEAGVNIFVDYNWGGFAFQNDKFGGIAFNVRESYSWYSKLNKQTTDIVFRGQLASIFDSLTIYNGIDTSRIANTGNLPDSTLAQVVQGTISVPLNLSQITKGSEIKLVWNRSYNFGYGRKILGLDSTFILYGGVGGRIISSMAMFNMQSTDDGLMVYSSITPAFNIDYSTVAGTNPLTYKGKGLPPAVGQGYGIDLSVSALIFKKFRVAASVNNIGAVTYTRNVYRVKDTLFGSYSLAGLADANITNSLDQLLSNGGILTLVGEEKYKLENPADFRFGAAFEPAKFLKLGFDMVAPFDRSNPGAIKNPVYSFGGEIRPVKWLALNAGYFGGGIYKNNIPLGVTFMLRGGAYECGIATRDALSFFMEESNSISTAFGFARFRF